MNTLRITGYTLLLFFIAAFKSISACEYAGSNINYVKSQTEKALANEDLNLIRYYTFKALNALEKSKKELEACKCAYASISVEESAYLLKRATRADDIKDSKDLLKRSLQNTLSGIDALEIHDEQHSIKRPELLAINDDRRTKMDEAPDNSEKFPFKEKLDASLEKYRKSLNEVVQTVNCNDARAFAQTIYDNCEQELLTKGLSEQKKYYNLRTQEITAEALNRIQEKCDE